MLSITNPNYDASAADDHPVTDDEEEEVDIFKSDSLAAYGVQHPLQVWPSSSTSAADHGECSDGNPRGNAVVGGGGICPETSRECDKSFRTGARAKVEQTEAEKRILPSRTQPIKAVAENEDDGAGVSSCVPDVVLARNNKTAIHSLPSASGKLSGTLSIAELPRRPLPSAV